MKPSSVCLPKSEIPLLLSGDMPPNEAAAAESHIAECESCRSTIESMIADSRWWDDARKSLVASATRSPLQVEVSHDTEPTTTAKLLDLLGPTDDPNMLGRIGPYEIIGLLGQGGMGAVFKGFDRSLNRFVAIKMLLPHLAASGAARKRFAREGQAVAAVVDDHVMAIHCVDEWQGVPYLVMTYSRGVSFQKRLSDNGPLLEGQARQHERLGKPFELDFIDAISGRAVSMKDFRGKVVVVDFWATWCGPCRRQIPELKRLYAQYHDLGVEFIGVSQDLPEDEGGLNALKEFVAQEEIPWPQFYSGGRDYRAMLNGTGVGDFSEAWVIEGIPTVFLIDTNGNLYSTDAEEQLEALITLLIDPKTR